MSAARMHAASLAAAPERVIGRLFLPGEDGTVSRSRASEIVDRVLAVPEADVGAAAEHLLGGFATRHPDVRALFLASADAVRSRLVEKVEMTDARRLLLGASFTAEFALEGAALCNPSAFAHPDQAGVAEGCLRVAVAVRAIGEGHLSSIGFVEAIIGADETWEFDARVGPPCLPQLTPGEWTIDHFRSAVAHEGIMDEVSNALLSVLPERFTAADIPAAAAVVPTELSSRVGGHGQVDSLRVLAESAYRATFDAATALSQRVLVPVAEEENHGMEDARFVRFIGEDGVVQYRAVYTAYDGRDIAPRLIVSPDLRTFSIHRLTGDAAVSKGMALFPRPIDGRHLAVCRTGGEDISLAESADGVKWSATAVLHTPRETWEMVQTGNCGSPIETSDGWIVLTHGVGPMRTYVLGALLLDLDDPSIVLGRSAVPLLEPPAPQRDGYVPNVVYSCGGIVHEGTLWIPVGLADSRIGVCSISVADLISALVV